MSVNARALLVKSKITGADPLVDLILIEGSTEGYLFSKSLDIKQSSLKAMYVESCLLASLDYERIGGLLEIDPEIIEMYKNAFYDVEGMDKLSKLELLAVEDRQEHMLKVWALSQGLDFIAWRLGAKTTVSPVDGLQELFSTAMYKAKEACFSGNASEESKEAVKWTKISMDLARLLKAYTMDSNQARNDIQLALREVVPEFEGLSDLMGE